MQNTERDEVGISDNDDDSNPDAAAGATRPNIFYQSNMLLGAEAAADFQALQGYWSRIIVKDMSGDYNLDLPVLSIA